MASSFPMSQEREMGHTVLFRRQERQGQVFGGGWAAAGGFHAVCAARTRFQVFWVSFRWLKSPAPSDARP
jgi:hypothetical protein